MKNFFLGLLALFVVSCSSVSPGHKGVEVSWGGKTNLQEIYPEGMSYGIHWLVDDMIEYNVKEQTMVQKYEFNDKNSMPTGVEFSLDFNLMPDKVNLLHVKVDDVTTKINKTLKSAGKEVVALYSAVELNTTARTAAEAALGKILHKELGEFYVNFARIQVTDVDIPKSVSGLAEETAAQLERNKLADKKEAEQVSLAKAVVAKADGEYQAAILNAKTRDLLSQPKMLELQRVENERLMWEGYSKHGSSPYGSNNVFGAETAIIRGLK